MNKKALLAICIALVIPLIGYFGLKYEGENAVTIPNKYLLDSVITKVENGKISTDSIWHTVQNIRLVNQLGDTVNLYDIKDKVIVADFFFTGCASICPILTHNMAKLQRSFERNQVQNDAVGANRVQFLSFTIDPLRDSVTRLKKYADNYGVNSDNWWFLTGNKDSIYNFIFQQLKVDKYNDTIPISPYFPHTARFVLLDRDFHIRGYYNGLDTVESLPKLAHDISLLMVEKDKAHPSALPFDPVEMGVMLLIAFVLVMIIARLIFKKKPQQKDATK
ncbi:SCO family protein [Arachidicoccus sp.]|uniref:SCO family protein n=1 Tax=Arachidicoccus sp. TaxID=1872624 RepID=UPI003D1E4098